MGKENRVVVVYIQTYESGYQLAELNILFHLRLNMISKERA